MKKSKEEKMAEVETDFFKSFSKDVGGDLLSEIDKSRGYIDTGNLAVNYILSGRFVGGGFATGSMHQVAGQSATGKSLLGTNFLKGCQKFGGIAIFHDAERAISKDFAIKASKVDPEKLIVTEADTLESSFNKIHKVIRQARDVAKIPIERPLCIVYDSLAVSPSEREFIQTSLDMETISDTALRTAKSGPEKPGERAKICAGELRKLMPVVKDKNVCLLFVNQLRKKIGVVFGSNTYLAGGGESIQYYVSSSLMMYSSKQLKNKDGKTIGMNVKLKNNKSRFTSPYQEASNVRLDFNHGIDAFGGLLQILIEAGRIEKTSKGNYKVREPWCNGKEIKFTSSSVRNDVPYTMLLECPSVVDAETPEQIQYYIDVYGEVGDYVNSENVIEEDLTEDQE
jgi:recombination protein RecA